MQRVAELETQLASMQADLDGERRRIATYSESDRSLNEAAADGYRGADAILRRASAEADGVLRRAIDDRRLLVNEVRRLREEREELHDEIASHGRGEPIAASEPVEIESSPAFDLQTAIAEEMRALLVEILADFRSPRAAPRPPVEDVPAKIETRAQVLPTAPAPILEDAVEEIQTVSPPATEAPPIETPESIVEHVDELVRLRSEPIIDDYVEELRPPRRGAASAG
jgi:hypothetical protein